MHLVRFDASNGHHQESLLRAMGGMSLEDSSSTAVRSSRGSGSNSTFRFFDLPSELRLRIYEYILLLPDRLIDLDPLNYRRILPRLSTFLVCRRMHDEASQIFYGRHTLRLFPMHGRFFNTKRSLLPRLPSEYRAHITSLELRLGPGWGAPPRCQRVDDALGLEECVALRVLRVFVELDPSGDIFNGFRGKGNARDTYKVFCTDLLRQVLQRASSVRIVEVDAYPSVTKASPLVVALVACVEEAQKMLVWGPLRGWDEDGDGGGQIGLESALRGMVL